MRRAWSAVPLLAVASMATACGSLELRPDDATAAEWTPAGSFGFEWTSGGIRLDCGGRANFDPGEFPVVATVRSEWLESVTMRIRHTVSDGSPIVGERAWASSGASPVPIVDGEPFVVPGSASRHVLRLRADRAWTQEEPMRDGDTVSYDIEITSVSGTAVCRLRMVVARRWSDTFDEWWEPIVFIPLIPFAIVVLPIAYAFSYVVYGHGIH